MPRTNITQVRMTSNLDQAKQLFDKELDAAYAETIKRWKLLMAESGLSKVMKTLKHGRTSKDDLNTTKI